MTIRKIEVKKEVTVSDKYIRATNDEYVLNVYDQDEEEGFTQLVIMFDSEQDCCEQADMVVKGYNPFGKRKRYLHEIIIDNDYSYVTDEGWLIDNKQAVRVVLDYVGFSTEIIFYNDHNGYYAHEIKMEHLDNNEVKFDYKGWL